MNLTIEENEKYFIITINEERLTSLSAPNFKAELVKIAQKNKSIVCDLKNVDYLDSAGLSSLLIGDRLLKEINQTFVICNVSEKAINLIKLTKLDNVLVIIASVSEATDYILMNEIEKNL